LKAIFLRTVDSETNEFGAAGPEASVAVFINGVNGESRDTVAVVDAFEAFA
jgi:hypothetical protein